MGNRDIIMLLKAENLVYIDYRRKAGITNVFNTFNSAEKISHLITQLEIKD